MLLTQFLLTNAHFIISLFAALVSFAITWLYFDAWLNQKDLKQTTLFFGFLILTLSFVVQATIIDQQLLQKSLLGPATLTTVKNILRLLGYSILILGQLLVPLQPLPEYRRTKHKLHSAPALFLPVLTTTTIPFLLPIFAITTALLYLHRATTGLEHHLKKIALAFFFLAIAELLNLATVFRDTTNVAINNLVAAFGPLWLLQHFFLLLSTLIFGRWVVSYLLKRFETQLFMIFTTSTLVIFLITTVFFTLAQLNNLKDDALLSLNTNASVLNYAIDSQTQALLADATALSINPALTAALSSSDRPALKQLTTPLLTSKKLSSLTITNHDGAVIFRAQDPQRFGDSLSDNPLLKKALTGQSVTSVTTQEGVLAPTVSLNSAVPAASGALLLSFQIDSAFVDGLKSATGLDSSIYAADIRSATTFIAPDGKSRFVGIKLDNQEVKKQVLDQGNRYLGSVNILNVPYFAAFTPLTDQDKTPVGMIFVGRPQVSLLQAASHSIELTFLTTVILLVFSIFPSYFVSKYLVSQIR